MAKFEEQLLTRVDLGISQFSASGCQEFGGGGAEGSCKSKSIPIFWKKSTHHLSTFLWHTVHTFLNWTSFMHSCKSHFYFCLSKWACKQDWGKRLMNWKTGLLQDLQHLLSLVEDMSPTNTAVEQHSSLLQYSLLTVPFTENTCKHTVKCITLLAYTTDLLSFTNLSMKLAFVPTSHSHSCLCKGFYICNMVPWPISHSLGSFVSDPEIPQLTSHPICVRSAMHCQASEKSCSLSLSYDSAHARWGMPHELRHGVSVLGSGYSQALIPGLSSVLFFIQQLLLKPL